MEENEQVGERGAGKGFFHQVRSLFHTADEQAMWRVQTADDGEAFALLVERWEKPIQRLCGRMLQDEHKAEDLTQEAFARIYAKRKQYQHGSKFSTFLWRVAVNLCLDELRRVKRRREFSVIGDDEAGNPNPWEELPSEDQSPVEDTEAEERARLVRRALQQLPEHYRAVVVLRHYENLKFREVADVLDVPIGTVKSRMSEALQMLNIGLGLILKAARAPKNTQRFTRESLVL
jgi:RNA polymerase sigma-70 factor, ECF subfamily